MMEKILENTYRNVNIGLINELAMLCDKMNINIWEVIEAAKMASAHSFIMRLKTDMTRCLRATAPT